jgi:hypothetical protein
MTFIYLPKDHPLTLKTLPDGVFYPIDNSSVVNVHVPYHCAPVKCIYSGDFFENHSLTNTFTNQVFENNHQLNLEVSDSTFYDSFYEITKIKCITFGEGEAWYPKTNLKIRELRDIVNEKDRLYSKMEAAASGTAPAPVASAAPTQVEGSISENVDLPVGGDGKSEVVEAVGLLSGLDDGQHADPWMQRRQMASQGRNFVAGNAEREPTVEERDKMLSSIVKDLF